MTSPEKQPTPAPRAPSVAFKKRSRSTSTKARKRARSTFASGSTPTDQHMKASKSIAVSTPSTQRFTDQISTIQEPRFEAGGVEPSATTQATATNRLSTLTEDSRPKSKSRSYGPQSAPAHLRVSVRVDYQPDVCKDYKETGYCGFGDSCKFLHDRSDYAAGWQLDRDWATRQADRRAAILRGEDPDIESISKKSNPDADDDGLPFACFVCRGDFTKPVITQCGHYFCEDCALALMKKIRAECAVCKKALDGTLNSASKLIRRLAERSARKVDESKIVPSGKGE